MTKKRTFFLYGAVSVILFFVVLFVFKISTHTPPKQEFGEVNNEIVMSELPPDPGEEGELTLEGIDSDNDGVRDDVQRWIALESGESEEVQSALHRRAALLQQTFSTYNSAELHALVLEIDQSEIYLEVRGGSEGIDYDLVDDLDEAFINTGARAKAMVEFDERIPVVSLSALDNQELLAICAE